MTIAELLREFTPGNTVKAQYMIDLCNNLSAQIFSVHNHSLSSLSEKSYNSLTNIPNLNSYTTTGLFNSITGNLQSEITTINSLTSSFSSTSHNHSLSSLSEKSYNSLTDVPGLLKLDQTTPQSVTGGSPTIEGIQFNTTPSTSNTSEGLLRWNVSDGTLDLGMAGGDITMQIGQEMFIKVRNVSGSTILNGTPVYINGRTGNRPNIYPAQANSETASCIAGITTQDIDSPSDGFITSVGYVRQIKTNYSGSGDWGTTWNAGDKLYISKTVAGQLTNIEPSAPHHSDIIGSVGVVGNVGVGSILVNIHHHRDMVELADINGTALTGDGQFPTWHQTEQYFDFDKNINNYVPYSGATTDVNLGAHGLNVGNNITTSGDIVFSKNSGYGVKVDLTTPTFAWMDLLGAIRIRTIGATDPTDAVYMPNIRQYQFDVGNECWIEYHLPHDYAMGTDIHLHFHWSCNSTAVTGGSVSWGANFTYAKGHNQASFTNVLTTSVVATASTSQYKHIISEVQISASSSSTSQIVNSIIEPDGLLLVRAYLVANNITYTGVTAPKPFLHFVDVHYQSTGIGTKQKAPGFWT